MQLTGISEPTQALSVQDCVNAIGEALHGKPNGKGGFNSCDCPVHGGRECLSVDVGDTGAITIYCYTCGKDGTPAIIEALKQMGLWPDSPLPSFALSPEQVEARQREQAEKKAQKARDQEAAAGEAVRLLKDASPDCQGHPYAKKKGKVFEDDVRRGAFPGIPDALLIPFKSSPLGPVQTVQAIGPAGKKRFLAGGQKKGSAAYFSVFFLDTPCLCIAEGVATAGAVWQATGLPCVAAGDAGNMLEVARKTRRLYKRAEIILLADEDPPGIEAAEKAAQFVGGKIARPQAALDTDAPDHYDFWDLWKEQGADAVKLALDKAQDAKDKKRIPLTGGEGDLPGNPAANQRRLHSTGFLQNSQLRAGETPMKKETLNDTLAGIPQNATGQNAQTPEVKFPPGYEMREHGDKPGLYFVERNEDGEPTETWICASLHILGITRNADGGDWGLLLQWNDRDNRQHRWAMPLNLLYGGDSAEYLKYLVGEGLVCSSRTKAWRLLKELLAGYDPKTRVLCVPRTGWHEDAYVFPDDTLYPKGYDLETGEQIVLQAARPHNPFAQQGSLEAWQETIGKLAQGNTRLVLALSAAFAAPLLEVCGLESGGFHFVGRSGRGKTIALCAAASAWGKGSRYEGYIRPWKATGNGLEGVAVQHSDALLCLDEIGEAPAKVIEEAAYMLANGTGKARARQDGTARPTQNWRCLFLSTGELSLAEKIAADGGRVMAGQQVRLLDIPATANEDKEDWGIVETLHGYPNTGTFVEAVKGFAEANYGMASRAFIRRFQQERQETEERLREDMRDGLDLFCPDDVDAQVNRAAKRFLLCAFAGEKAAEWGIVPWNAGEATEAARICFQAWLDQRGSTGPAEDAALKSRVLRFLEQHGNSRFQDIDSPDEKCQNRAGFRKKDGDTFIYYVLKEQWKEVTGYDSDTRAGKILFEAGILKKTPDKTRYPQKVTLPGMGRTRCYILTFPDTPDTEKDN